MCMLICCREWDVLSHLCWPIALSDWRGNFDIVRVGYSHLAWSLCTLTSPFLLLNALQTLFPYDTEVNALVSAISALRASASGAADDQGLFKDTDSYVLAPSDANAVAFSRTPAQVQFICCEFLSNLYTCAKQRNSRAADVRRDREG